MISLPIDSVLPDVRKALRDGLSAVLAAEPGAGKTTRVPLALLNEKWLAGGRIVMLEPRRLAAQRAADYMAQLLGEKRGESVGYRIRGETRVGSRTRIEVVTEGVLTRMLQSDPALSGVGLVIFDEFHERSIHADLGLALTLDVQQHLRSDLRILVMSATLDIEPVAMLLGNARVIRSEGRAFPVTTHYLSFAQDGPVEPFVVKAILRALHQTSGDILVFLPGRREIRRVEALIVDEQLSPTVSIHTLFGDAPLQMQRSALSPAPAGMRKVILSTSVAETSVTIDGVRAVIDSGLARSARFDPRRGMTGLVTAPVSQAAADQRRGRAGRQNEGICFRLWTGQQHSGLPLFAEPEIRVADLAPLALDLSRWGSPGGENLRFLDPPPVAHLLQARNLLRELGAIDAEGKPTQHGRAMAELPVHPRLAHMLIKSKDLGLGALACDVAALLEERDVLHGERDTDVDLASRWHVLHHGGSRDTVTRDRVRIQADRLRKVLGVHHRETSGERLGVLLALAYPERVAKRVDRNGGRYQLAGGPIGYLPRASLLSREEYLAVGDVDGVGTEVRILLAEGIGEEDIREAFSGSLVVDEEVGWDSRKESVLARRVERLGALALSETTVRPSTDALRTAVMQGIRQLGIHSLSWTRSAISLRARSEWLRMHQLVEPAWPDLSEVTLMNSLEHWLGPFLEGVTRRSDLQRVDIDVALKSLFSFNQLRTLDRLAPTHLSVPTGSRIPVEYGDQLHPVLAVRLQEMFGETRTPSVAGGKVNVVLHLLSPARRPLAVTRDLRSFWKNAYPEVRKDMRGRYPKHHWPENPLEAKPTRRTKR